MGLLALGDALAKTFACLPTPSIISLPLQQSLHHILAEELYADQDLPPFPKSAVDGYAILATNPNPPLPFSLKVVGLSKAGSRWHGTLQPGQACQIMTGAPVPEGTERIVMVENTLRENDQVQIQVWGQPRQHIQPRAKEIRQGELILSSGTYIRSVEIGALATFGKANVAVFRKPSVGVIATGDELVEPHQIPNEDQIRNSNGYALTAQIQSAGFDCTFLGVARDTKDATLEKLTLGLQKDVLILSGGVSMGEFDFVKVALLEKGASFEFDQIALKPGKPLVFGKVANTFIFGLPGNPGSSFTTCELFVIPFLKGIAGFLEYPSKTFPATLSFPFLNKGNRIQYLPVWLTKSESQIQVQKVPYEGSADVVALTRANAFLRLEPNISYQPGDAVQVQIFSENSFSL